jgi:dTDP-4-dehydrorhamnose reductase
MKILVTGANGQLGNELRQLEKSFPRFQMIFTDVAELDLVQLHEIESYFNTHSFDVVINCAAYTAVDKAETDITFAHILNVDAVKNLATVCKVHQTKLIHISTDYVFNGKSWIPYSESDELDPQSVYGFTKLNGERELERSGVEYMIIRTSWLYSSFGHNFVKTMLRLGREKQQLGVVFDQVGSPTFAGDLSLAILTILQTGKFHSSQIYHYSNEGACSWYDFAVEIMKLSNLPCKVYPIETKDYPLPATRPPYSVFNKAKIKQDFGIAIPHWAESLRTCIRQINHIELLK